MVSERQNQPQEEMVEENYQRLRTEVQEGPLTIKSTGGRRVPQKEALNLEDCGHHRQPDRSKKGS